ncbi:MAG: glycosyltransferase family 39 protein [Blastochloris sp.]|nr:glycosyltransferase family 39 protein [Blastochloris sp.]
MRGLGELRDLLRNSTTAGLLLACVVSAAYFFHTQTKYLLEKPMVSAIAGWDNSFYYFWLRSAFLERPFDFRQSMEQTRTLPEHARQEYLKSEPTRTGRLANKYGVGWAISSVPFYLLADGVVLIHNSVSEREIKRDGYGPVYQYALLGGQLLYAAASLFLAWRVVRRFVPDPAALHGVLLIWLTSFLYVYQTWMLSMAHNLVFFAVMWMFWASLKLREEPTRMGWWVQVGVAAGLALITRYQSGLYLLFPAYVVGMLVIRGGTRERWVGWWRCWQVG